MNFNEIKLQEKWLVTQDKPIVFKLRKVKRAEKNLRFHATNNNDLIADFFEVKEKLTVI